MSFSTRRLGNPGLFLLLVFSAALAVAVVSVAGDRPTEERANAKYVGAAVCAGCHETQADTQRATAMGKAAAAASTCAVLVDHRRLNFQSGRYRYTITREGATSMYSVTDGHDTISVPIEYCFGQGRAGQTYILTYNGSMFESRLSYYSELDGLDLTMGYPPNEPDSLLQAMGRKMSVGEQNDCFGCHATRAVGPHGLQLSAMTPGLTCEGCHGPGAGHVEAVRALRFNKLEIVNPGKHETEDITEFCGSCHRTWADVMLGGLRGPITVRFQPYRLVSSRCYDPADKRIACVACHDPHRDPVHKAEAYDAKCLACHSAGKGTVGGEAITGHASKLMCKAGTKGCVTCHMPKLPLGGSHALFTDHQIRVVRANEPVLH